MYCIKLDILTCNFTYRAVGQNILQFVKILNNQAVENCYILIYACVLYGDVSCMLCITLQL